MWLYWPDIKIRGDYVAPHYVAGNAMILMAGLVAFYVGMWLIRLEIAGLFSAVLAYGRVDLFLPLLDRLCVHMDASGGPRAWVESLDIDVELVALDNAPFHHSPKNCLPPPGMTE